MINMTNIKNGDEVFLKYGDLKEVSIFKWRIVTFPVTYEYIFFFTLI